MREIRTEKKFLLKVAAVKKSKKDKQFKTTQALNKEEDRAKQQQ